MATGMIPPLEHVMEVIMTSSQSSSSSSSSAANVVTVLDDCFEDGCSICLEPFNSHNPLTVTNCKHEYHLQCILEWSQRSTECPICCQLLALKDPASQALLEAAKSDKGTRSRSNIRIVREHHEVSHGAPCVNDSDLEQQILQHFAAATGRTHYGDRRRRATSSGIDSSEVFPSVPFAIVSNMHTSSSRDEWQNVDYGFDVGLNMTSAPESTIEPELSPVLTPENIDCPVNHRNFFGQTSPDGPRRSSSSEFTTFSESVKAKFSAASARYKESITKSTRGFKEKLLARNSSVKELGKGVQREMSAGIAGVARMIERFDLSSKRTGGPIPFSTSSEEKPNLADSIQSLKERLIKQSPGAVSGDNMQDTSSDISTFSSTTTTGRVEVSLI